MTESEYIKTSNIVNLRAVSKLCDDLHEQAGIESQDIFELHLLVQVLLEIANRSIGQLES